MIQPVKEKKMPTKPKVEVVEEPEEKELNPFFDAARKVLLAAIGAVALAQEEIEDFVNKLVDRGEIAEKDGKKLVRELMERRKKEAEKAEEELSKSVESVLDRMNVPSKADIDALSEKITALTKKIEELKKS
jgi:poly(hydroxyalkanoate) granule-associated protein